jgi:malate permease and related proteins
MLEPIFSVLPVILFFLLGYTLKKRAFFIESTVRDFKKTVSNLALPALLFQAFASLELKARYLLLILMIFLLCNLMILLGKLGARLLKVPSHYFSLMMGGFEMGMLGYALFLSLYGQHQLSRFALIDLGQVIFVFFVLMTLLFREKGGKGNPAVLLKNFLTSPVILAIFTGILVSFLRLLVPPNGLSESLNHFITLLGGLTVPLISLMIGYELSFRKEGIIWAVKTVLFRKVLLFLLALAVNRIFIRGIMGLERIYEFALFTMFLLPPPFVISIYMKQEDKEALDYVNNTLSLSTVVSVLFIIGISLFY